MEDIFLRVVDLSVMACWIILVVLILRIVLKRAPKWVNCLLWGIVAVRLVCPVSLESSFSLMPDITPASEMFGNRGSAIDDQHISDKNQVDSQISGEQITGNQSLGNQMSEGQTVGSQSQGNQITTIPPIHNQISGEQISQSGQGEQVVGDKPSTVESGGVTIIGIASFIWCSGIGLMLVVALVGYIRLKLQIRTAIPFAENIYKSENVASPFVLGLIKPRIYLPFAIDEDSLDYIVSHEKAHIRRGDNWIKIIAYVILAIYWFNPCIWLAYVMLCKDIELACDEHVVKSRDSEYRKAYSRALVANSVNHRAIEACPLAFGEVGVKDRVRNVIRYRKPAYWVIVLAVVVSVTTGVCLLTSPAKGADAGKNTDNGQEQSTSSTEKPELPNDDEGETPVDLSVPSPIILENAEDILKQRADMAEYDVGITLPEGAYVTPQIGYRVYIWGDILLGIEREGSNPTVGYTYGDKILHGWIEIAERGLDTYEYIDDTYPCPFGKEWTNYEAVNGGYICEADGYWCIVFETELNYELHSNWIYLNMECFTKEEAMAVARSYIPDWECDNLDSIIYKGDTIYVVEDGKVSESIQPAKVEWHNADVEYTSENKRIGKQRFSFQWCEYNGGICLKNAYYNWQGFGWEISTVPGNRDEVVINLMASAVCEYVYYNLRTGEITYISTEIQE